MNERPSRKQSDEDHDDEEESKDIVPAVGDPKWPATNPEKTSTFLSHNRMSQAPSMSTNESSNYLKSNLAVRLGSRAGSSGEVLGEISQGEMTKSLS